MISTEGNSIMMLIATPLNNIPSEYIWAIFILLRRNPFTRNETGIPKIGHQLVYDNIGGVIRLT